MFFRAIIILFVVFSSHADENYFLDGVLDSLYVKDNADLNRPPGIFHKILSWREEGSLLGRCLLYRSPLGLKKGVILIYETSDCSLKNIKKKKKLDDDVDHLEVIIDSQIIKLKTQKNTFIFNFPFIQRWTSLSYQKKRYGDIVDGEVCRQYDNHCVAVINSCHKCKNIFFTPSLNRFCSNHSERTCGEIDCGEKNQQACLRMISNKKQISCDVAITNVSCKRGFSVYCESDGRMICK